MLGLSFFFLGEPAFDSVTESTREHADRLPNAFLGDGPDGLRVTDNDVLVLVFVESISVGFLDNLCISFSFFYSLIPACFDSVLDPSEESNVVVVVVVFHVVVLLVGVGVDVGVDGFLSVVVHGVVLLLFVVDDSFDDTIVVLLFLGSFFDSLFHDGSPLVRGYVKGRGCELCGTGPIHYYYTLPQYRTTNLTLS